MFTYFSPFLAILLVIIGVMGILISILFKLEMVISKIIGKIQAKKDIHATEIEIEKQMNRFVNETNYYKQRNEIIRQQAIDKMNNEIKTRNSDENEISDVLKKNLVFLKNKYPLADNDFFIEYSNAFFLRDINELKKIEQKMKISNEDKIRML